MLLSSDSPGPMVEMRIAGGSPITQISVTDADFQTVPLDQNAGRVALQLPPGMYKIRFQEGDWSEEQMALLLPDGPSVDVVQEAPVLFESAVPLVDTSTTHEYQMGPAVDLSVADPQVQWGSASQLTVFARTAGVPETRQGRSKVSKMGTPSEVAERLDLVQADPAVRGFASNGATDPTSGLTIHDADGSEIAAVSDGIVNNSDRVGGLKCEVDPGTYRLRVDTGMDRLLEMPVVCVDGWQTMLFLLTRSYTDDDGSGRADLDRASVSLLASGSDGFQPVSEVGRLTELALQALAGRRTLHGTELNGILHGKFEDPMLGVYGGHLLLMQEKPDLDLVDLVIRNTESLMPDHPDVLSLRLKVALLTGDLPRPIPVFETPPMLGAGWQAVVAATRLEPDVVPMGSLSDRISDRIARSGPWLVWANPPELDETLPKELPESMISEAGAAVRNLHESLMDPDTQEWAADSESLDPTQQVFAQTIVPQFDPVMKQILDKWGEDQVRGVPLDNEISQDLNMPVNSVRRLATELDKKLRTK